MIHLSRLYDNLKAHPFIHGLAVAAALLYATAAALGDLTARLPLYWALHAALVGIMIAAWRRIRQRPGALRTAVVAALLFRAIAALGEPALSDDVHRYVWDGRVQTAGIHPYAHAPLDPALEGLRDASWTQINNPEVRTIYPPLAQMLFAALAAIGAGPAGFKLAFGLIDAGVVLLLARLLSRLGLPRDRLVLYAWNPLAVMESAGSGHVEPLGVLFVLLAVLWITGRRPWRAAWPLAAAVQVKLLPLVLIPGSLRRLRLRGGLLLVAALVAIGLPYALTGPAVGSGLFEYAGRWERNAVVYAGVEAGMQELDTAARLKPWVGRLQARIGEGVVPWDFVYRHVWPRDIARLAVFAAALAWLVWLATRRNLSVPREYFLALAGVLLLSPTLHPWYLLWVLPFAAAFLSPGWLTFAALVPLAYAGGAGDVPWALRVVEYGVPLAVSALAAYRRGVRS